MDHEKAVEIVHKLAAVNVGKTANDDARLVKLIGEARQLVNPSEDATDAYVAKKQIAKTMDWMHEHYKNDQIIQVHDIVDILRRIVYF